MAVPENQTAVQVSDRTLYVETTDDGYILRSGETSGPSFLNLDADQAKALVKAITPKAAKK